MMGPFGNVLGLLGLGLSTRTIHPKVCCRCKRFIKVSDGYRETKDGLIHGRCTDEATEGKTEPPPQSKEPPMG